MPRISREKRQAIERKFNELDTSGDGKLSLSELSVLLKRGNPRFRDSDVLKLYKAIDKNHDSYVSFSEFVEYIYKTEQAKDASEAGCNWATAERAFYAFGGEDGFASTEWNKFCEDCGLCEHGFQSSHVDLVFSMICGRGKKKLVFPEFQDCIREVARRQRRDLKEVLEGLADSASHAEPVYRHTEVSATAGGGFRRTGGDLATRHARLVAEAAAEVDPDESDYDWQLVENSFKLFAGGDFMDMVQFKKLCKDTGIISSNFSTGDADILFQNVKLKGEREIDFTAFQDIVRKIAKRKGCRVVEVQGQVMSSSGPSHRGTRARQTRLSHQ
eukprot:TRINITY_DN108691_c0_g1_i1.p1 TRINITY_DN108691_c0_g1~~TRINITY_DN108691_c0_g1_i1.p1  ORF type:complete len:329 (+),score=68.43 TRINITY_DN108691_c0_g1_i1:57-1043(+)